MRATSVTSREHDDTAVNADLAERIRQAMAMLRSEHDGDRGVVAIAACGAAAVPALLDFAFHRDPSGLYQARGRAVEALAALDAREALRDLLRISLDRSDPVERTGDEAVVNAAARALIGSHDESVFQILLHLARHKHLTGVVEALGTFGRPEAIPRLIDALAEDCSRPVAETALQSYGAAAVPPLWEAVGRQDHSVSDLRQRHSALRLLLELGASSIGRATILELQRHPDLEIRVFANEFVLMSGVLSERRCAAARLIDLLPTVDWPVTVEIEDALIKYAPVTAPLVRQRLCQHLDVPTLRSLRRINAMIMSLEQGKSLEP